MRVEGTQGRHHELHISHEENTRASSHEPFKMLAEGKEMRSS